MAEHEPADADQAAEIQAKLKECAKLLREARHLDAESQTALANLVVELADALDPAAHPEHASHLGESSAQLIEALHARQDSGLITSARERLEQAAARAEAEAPVATGVARQLIDALASIGI